MIPGGQYLAVCFSEGHIMEDYIKVATLNNEIEARLLESILDERDIPYRLRSYHDTAYDGLFQTQKGWGTISAPASCKDEITEILSDMRKEAEASGADGDAT
jgi:hypothetical protein